MSARRARGLGLALLAAAAVACRGADRPIEQRYRTDDFALRVSADPVPPPARERILYKVIVSDKESRAPIEGGEGRIFASSRDGASTWDILSPGPELGTYYGNLNFVTAGEWAIAIEFRRDSTQKLQRVDWIQEVRAAREGS